MIPATWVAHVRDDDGELLGYLDTGDEGMLARTVFGFLLGVAGDEAAARSTLDSIGLSYLAERWMLALPSREERITVEIVEATPDRLVVKSVDYGYEGDYGTQFTLAVPVGDTELRPERSL